jgi:uncharacterized protein (TIGR02145 family)
MKISIQHRRSIILSLVLTIAACCSENTDPTLSGVPVLTTTNINNITSSTASSGGNITSNGGSDVTVRGVCWSTTPNPTIANSKTNDGIGTGTFVSSITGLTNNTTYYLRAYATNSEGTGYGNELSFIATFPNCGTVTDIDGNVYTTVTIGTQCWMQENLKTTRYNDGSAVAGGLSDAAWQANTSGAYAIYDNNAANNSTYGKLYNWYAVNSGKLAPAGWHIPSDAEWKTLTTYLGGDSIAGDKMKAGILWTSYPDIVNNNSSGFSGLPAGYRTSNGTYDYIGINGYFWSSTEYSSIYAWYRTLFHRYSDTYRYFNFNGYGFSVRCVKD